MEQEEQSGKMRLAPGPGEELARVLMAMGTWQSIK